MGDDVYVHGGFVQMTPNVVSSDMLTLNPLAGLFTSQNSDIFRYAHASFYDDQANRLIFCGGIDGSEILTGTIFWYDITTATWEANTGVALATPRSGHQVGNYDNVEKIEKKLCLGDSL